MPTIHYIQKDGSTRDIEAKPGSSVMENAIRGNVRGIDAECGGCCSCATCHVYIQPEWLDRVGPAQGGEREMLDFALDVRGGSRLACQITVSPQLNGLVVGMPVAQS